MHREAVSIAEAKSHFSELINKVAYGHEEIIITKRGKPIAVISAPSEKKGLASAKGWLDEKDPFFKTVDEIVEKRHSRGLRAAKGSKG
ncbi:MAG: type II toxin-antitoxin system prevent-host-death family antitoxin [Nitrospirota bacterium]|nr:type II toxin-antitoxin system prevent-host-death family antitoxin [Nitrospirota bacterium]